MGIEIFKELRDTIVLQVSPLEYFQGTDQSSLSIEV